GLAGSGKSRLIRELKYHAQLQTVAVADLLEIPLGKLGADTLLIAEDIAPDVLKWVETWLLQFSTHSFLILLTGKNLPDSHHIGLKIHLGNFDPPTVALYISSVFGMDGAPDFLVEEMYRRTEGNPLLLTQ